MQPQTESTRPWFLRSHFAIVSIIIFLVGLGVILLSEQTPILVLGAVALAIAHLAAFGGLFLFLGGWIADRFRNNKK